jgi:hypothetical protein
MSNVKSIRSERAKRTKADDNASQATDAFASSRRGPPKGFEYPLFKLDGVKMTESEMPEALDAHAPWASAGDYKAVFSSMGCSRVEIFESTSSSGDWTFAVKRRGKWHVGSQENGYPRGPGFYYNITSEDIYELDMVGFEDIYEFVDRLISEEGT